jgi:MYXO-CTERM domain-containing protein
MSRTSLLRCSWVASLFVALFVAAPAAAQDADGDGVRNALDLCPGTRVGTTVDAAGCDSFCEAVPVAADQFVRTRWIEVGVGGPAGSFGAPATPPSGWHPRGGNPGIGFITDPERTGWVMSRVDGDYFVPGDPEEAWGLTIDGVHYMNREYSRGERGVPGAFTGPPQCVPNICGNRSGARISWSGAVAGINVQQSVSIVSEGFYILMEVTLTNTTSAPHLVYYMRNLDPDNMVTLSGDFSTRNLIVSNGIVTATTAAPYESYLALGSADPDARVSFGGFSERRPSDAWNCGISSFGTPYACTPGSTAFHDQAIQLTIRKNLAPGASTSFALVYTLNPSDITESINCTVPSTCGNGTLEGAESCDDGNMAPGDGCSAACDVEPGWICDPTTTPTRCRMRCGGPADCSDGIECTDDLCDLGTCRNPPSAAYTRCSAGVCNGRVMCVECLDSSSCSGARPICDIARSVCVGCLSGADCNDANECTADACTSGACRATSLTRGTPCSGGVCTGGAAPRCVECVDDTTCAGATPRCDVARSACVECIVDSDCGAIGLCVSNRCAQRDSDGDGVDDDLDPDADQDGITDAVEGGGRDASGDRDGDRVPDYLDRDFPGFTDADMNGVDDRQDQDGDGIPSFVDLDSDNDGIPDVVENGPATADADRDGRYDDTTDADGDGLVAAVDEDDTDATIIISMRPITDTDADGEPDFLELESDGDGLWDLVEAGGVDADADGLVDGFTDADGNGLAALVDPGERGMPLATPDTDRDRAMDFQDIDDDGDSIFTVHEAPDADGDGRPRDARDTDGDALPDYLDPDDDGDGVGTFFEEPDKNMDGNPLDARNTDERSDGGADRTPDYLDADDDGDGIPTDREAADPNADRDPADARNSDGDSDPDFLDGDDDGDEISTRAEAADGAALTPPATDLGPPDADSDPHWLDTDSDGDTVPDRAEGRDDLDADGIPDYLDPDSAPTDTDMDGLRDDVECLGLRVGAVCPDSDGDGDPDWDDPDDDGDGVLTSRELPNGDTDGDSRSNHLDPDDDGDGIPTRDERPGELDRDSDSDGASDHLDADDDDDGILTSTEVADAAMHGEDVDMDGLPNWRDPNADGDAGTDEAECGVPVGCPDSDADGIPDYLDNGTEVLDSDGDGLNDPAECPSEPCRDTDGDGMVDYLDPDDDGDGIPTREERPGMMNVDSDTDGLPDYLDPDDDNDTVPTREERPGMTSVDTDRDGTTNHLDADDDGDGIPTRTEVADSEALGDDDVDADGTPAWLDTSSDNDTSEDAAECPMPQPACADADVDGVPDYLDDERRRMLPPGSGGGGCGCIVLGGHGGQGGALALLAVAALAARRRRRRR